MYVAPRGGVWCPGLAGWDEFVATAATGGLPAGPAAEPVPALLPPREARRSPLLVRLALEVGSQACRGNDVTPADVTTVFASAQGDLEITDYLCRALAGPAPQLSPTRFHNSVHNAAAGYWSIATGNRGPGTALAAGDATAAMALLEAALLARAAGPVLVMHVDIAALPPLATVLPSRAPAGAALLVAATPRPGWRALDLRPGEPAAAAAAGHWWQALAPGNPVAPLLGLLAALAVPAAGDVALPSGPGTALGARLDAAPASPSA